MPPKVRLFACDEDYSRDRAYSDRFTDSIFEILSGVRMPIRGIRLASHAEDTRRATDAVATTSVACRIRRPKFASFTDVTIRSLRLREASAYPSVKKAQELPALLEPGGRVRRKNAGEIFVVGKGRCGVDPSDRGTVTDVDDGWVFWTDDNGGQNHSRPDVLAGYVDEVESPQVADSGRVDTEIDKMFVQDNGDVYFYGTGAEDNETVSRYVVLDIGATRKALLVQPRILGREIPNADGRTFFRCIDVSKLPSDCVLSMHAWWQRSA